MEFYEIVNSVKETLSMGILQPLSSHPLFPAQWACTLNSKSFCYFFKLYFCSVNIYWADTMN